MQPTDRAWLAGLIDGDGHASVYVHRDHRHGVPYLVPVVNIVMMDGPWVEHLKGLGVPGCFGPEAGRPHMTRYRAMGQSAVCGS